MSDSVPLVQEALLAPWTCLPGMVRAATVARLEPEEVLWGICCSCDQCSGVGTRKGCRGCAAGGGGSGLASLYFERLPPGQGSSLACPVSKVQGVGPGWGPVGKAGLWGLGQAGPAPTLPPVWGWGRVKMDSALLFLL